MSVTKPPSRIELTWTGGESFSAKSGNGVELTLDGGGERGLSPTQALLSSLCACMGIDVVLILNKMRSGLDGLRVTVEGDRREEPPRYFHSIRMRFQIEGTVPRDRAERAVALSLERYCSVFHTLRKDVSIETSVEIVTPPAG